MKGEKIYFQSKGRSDFLLKTNQKSERPHIFICLSTPRGKILSDFLIFQKLSWMEKRQVCDAADI